MGSTYRRKRWWVGRDLKSWEWVGVRGDQRTSSRLHEISLICGQFLMGGLWCDMGPPHYKSQPSSVSLIIFVYPVPTPPRQRRTTPPLPQGALVFVLFVRPLLLSWNAEQLLLSGHFFKTDISRGNRRRQKYPTRPVGSFVSCSSYTVRMSLLRHGIPFTDNFRQRPTTVFCKNISTLNSAIRFELSKAKDMYTTHRIFIYISFLYAFSSYIPSPPSKII